MTKQDIIIVVILVLMLGAWFFYQNGQTKKRNAAIEQERMRQMELAMMANGTNTVSTAASDSQAPATVPTVAPVVTNSVVAATPQPAVSAEEPDSGVEAKYTTISNNLFSLTLSTKGGAIVDTTLFGYRRTVEKDSSDIVLGSTNAPALALGGLVGLGAKADYEIVSSNATNVTFRCKGANGLQVQRSISLLGDYQVEAKDTFENTSDAPLTVESYSVGIGQMRRDAEAKIDQFSVDALGANIDGRGGYGKVDHWEKKNRVVGILTGRSSSGGCSRAPMASAFPMEGSTTTTGPQEWVAIKSRFFTHILSSSVPNSGFRVDVSQMGGNGAIQLETLSGALLFPSVTFAPGEKVERAEKLYIGPKKYSILRHIGPKTADIMDFGFWKYISIVVLWLLNTIYSICHSYGIAIILITILVRVAFWPLTHKSTESMKRMQEVQPILKEIQAKFKDDPQKLQQETMAVYRKYHVNPMSSCLPMLIQMPFFIAIFYVLRSAVELRFAPFLWILDLSEPENLFANWFPFGGLNILPLVMAGTMYLQSKLSPSMGDQSQQKMMIWMMPLLMLFMFYRMPSALVLYWSASQILAIIQLWKQKRIASSGPASGATIEVEAETMTRQARRRAEREG